LNNLHKALSDCDIGLLKASTQKAARKSVPTEVIRTAVEQAQTGKKLLILG
jgi:hypothetical protein